MECSSKEMVGVHEIFDMAIEVVVAESEGLKLRSDSLNADAEMSSMTMPTAAARKKKRSPCRLL